MAVVLSNGAAGDKWMQTFRPNATFLDATGHDAGAIQADANGRPQFRCPGGSASVWLQQ